LIILLGVQKAPHLIKYRVLSASSPRCGFFYKKILIFAFPKKKNDVLNTHLNLIFSKSAGKNINRARNVFSFISVVENTCMCPDK
jgi:hypothetical protein